MVTGLLGVVRCAVVGGHVARCAVVSGRVARWILSFCAVGSFQVARCTRCDLSKLYVAWCCLVPKLGLSEAARPLCDARCPVVSDHSRCIAASLVVVVEL